MSDQQKASLKQVAYDYIKEKILNCEYAPGSFLNEKQLCEEMDHMSRTPVRDALSRLEQDGLITILPKRGVVVAEMKLSDINRIFEVRSLLEPYALRHYGQGIDKDEIMRIRGALLSETEGGQPHAAGSFDLDSELHGAIMRAVTNPYLLQGYESVINLNRRFRIRTGAEIKDRIPETIEEHLEIIDAILRGDLEGSASALERHLEHSRRASLRLVLSNDAVINVS